MNRKDMVIVWIVCLLLVAIQFTTGQHFEIRRLRDELRITKSAQKIADDQIRDISYELQQARVTAEADHTRWFVAGVVSAVEKPDRYTEIWHAGYDRGTEVQRVANELDAKTATFTSDK
jgi:hypothetical protein